MISYLQNNPKININQCISDCNLYCNLSGKNKLNITTLNEDNILLLLNTQFCNVCGESNVDTVCTECNKRVHASCYHIENISKDDYFLCNECQNYE